MIPVEMQPEPENFADRVREPGKAFLAKTKRPIKWDNHEYWRDVLEDAYSVYQGICAYSADWISPSTGVYTIDHFIPKSANPILAYEWSNFRLSCLRCNSKKWAHRDVLDPFELAANSFILDFPSLMVRSNPDLEASHQLKVSAARDRLQLNDERVIKSRLNWVLAYCHREITFGHLEMHSPFIAYELRRQQLIEIISSIMLPDRRSKQANHALKERDC